MTFCVGADAAVGQADFDLERIAAIDGRRPRGGSVELARHDLVQALEDQVFADRADAVGRRGRDFGVLDRLEQSLSACVRPSLRVLARVLTSAVRADSRAIGRRDARETCREETRASVDPLRFFEHRGQPAQLDAVGVRLDFLRLGRQHFGRALRSRSRSRRGRRSGA